MFVLAIIFFILALIGIALAFIVGTKTTTSVERTRPDRYSDYREETVTRRGTRKWFFLGSGFFFILGVLFTIFSSTFSVEEGSSVVLKDWTGVVQEEAISTAGLHTKAPWQDTIVWDIRNQNVFFSGDGTSTHNGQPVNGAEIVLTDKDGISSPADIQVLFSIKPDSVVELTKRFANQADFEISVVENDVKAVPRDVVSTFTNIQVIEERPRLGVEVEQELKKRWADQGVIIENVNIQGIRLPEAIRTRYEEAQSAKTDLLKAETAAKTAKTTADGEAQAAISRANGEAEANRLIAASLTPEVLQQRYIDALAGANTIIVPNNFTSLGQLPGNAQ